MQLVPAGISLSFEVTYDSPSLPVAMSVFNDSGVTPTLVQGPLAMLNVIGNTYRGKFTAGAGVSYLILKAVYTDMTFTTIDTNYGQSSETIVAELLTTDSNSVGVSVMGLVDNPRDVIGIISC